MIANELQEDEEKEENSTVVIRRNIHVKEAMTEEILTSQNR